MRESLKRHHLGPLAIALAALLWATDSVFRTPAAASLDPVALVFLEHLLGGLVLLAWVAWRHGTRVFDLRPKEWVAAAAVGCGGSALATVLFTASFRYANPSVVVLLQKLQPILVVGFAYLVLGERPRKRFFFWAGIALLSAILLGFPDMDFRIHQRVGGLESARGILYATVAAILWGAATVGGKLLLNRTPCSVAVFWRYFFALVTLGGFLLVQGTRIPWSATLQAPVQTMILYLALMTGIVPMAAYYAGLARTSASAATFIELIYPVGAVALNFLLLDVSLAPIQAISSGLLLVAVVGLSLRSRELAPMAPE